MHSFEECLSANYERCREMIATHLGLIVDIEIYEKIIFNNLEIYWKGFIFLPGLKDGKESLIEFINKYYDYEVSLENLYGSYVLIIKDINSEQIICSSDNSGFMKIYYHQNTISDSFITLTKYIKASNKDLDFQGIAEFIRMGFCFDRTYIKGLSILNKRFYIKLVNNEISILPKKISAITNEGTDFYDYFQNLAKTLEGRKTVCDLTGGVDSRLIVSLMEYSSLDYDVSLSGKKDFIDHIKCLEISEILGKKPVFFDYCEEFNNNIAQEVYKGSDAQFPILESYRNYYYDKNLKDSGYYIRLTGGNGELFKDEAWAKPYYLIPNKKLRLFWKRNCNNFKTISQGLTDMMLGEIETINNKILQQKTMLEMNKATQTQDNYNYEIIMFYKASNFNIIANNIGLKQYSPLMEYDIARVGFNLNRRKRTAVRFHKEVITKTCPQIAKVKTVKNYTCFNSSLYIIRDYIVNSMLLFESVYRRIMVDSSPKMDGATGDNLIYKAKENCEIIETLLKTFNIIESAYKLTSANDVLFDRLYTIGMFLEQINSVNQNE